MTKKQLLEQLKDFPDDKEIFVWHDDLGLIKTDYVAENISDKEDKDNGAAVIYLDIGII